MQSLLEFLKSTKLREKIAGKYNHWVLCPSGSSSLYPLPDVGEGRQQGTSRDWLWEEWAWFLGEKDSQDQWRLWGFTIFPFCFCYVSRVFSSGAHRSSLEQSDSEQLLQFFTKSRWLDMKFQIQPLCFKSIVLGQEVTDRELPNFVSSSLENCHIWVLHLKGYVMICHVGKILHWEPCALWSSQS